jgi:hypothetical protein
MEKVDYGRYSRQGEGRRFLEGEKNVMERLDQEEEFEEEN